MSTRASIRIKESDTVIFLYYHSDGYLNNVGVRLIKTLSGLEWYNDDIYNIANRLIKIKFNDFELTSCIHGDESYFYLVDVNKQTLSANKGIFNKFGDKEPGGEDLFVCKYSDKNDVKRCIEVCNK
jgi:hypothetical protein